MAKKRSSRSKSPGPAAAETQSSASSPVSSPPRVKTPKARAKSPTSVTKSPSSSSRSPSAGAKGKAKSASSYKSDGVQDNDLFGLPLSDYLLLLFLTALAAVVRIFRIYQPTSVVFDEVHFGGFASKYIKGKFFMDVHPPLAKMVIALSGWLAGFDGEFDFKEIGKDYLAPGVPYVSMRLFPALCGILLAPFMFLTLKTVGCRSMTAAMGAGLIIFENGLLTQARLILLDSPLVAATAFTVLAFTSFTNQHEQGPAKAFQPTWWLWLVLTGLGLGITSSIKWVGLFTIAWVGCLTLLQLWVLLGDNKNVTMRLWFKHFMARAVCLVFIPVAFYLAMFAIHFTCLTNPGEGDGFMSSEFQATLNTKGMKDVAADVALGSRVSIRHVNTHGGYLHSHPLMYPTGSKQQQITLYPHKDDNNIWIMENQTYPDGIDGKPIIDSHSWDQLPNGPSYITDGSIIRLFHIPTHRRLHSHNERPPVTEATWQQEVSAYGHDGFEGDANDQFRVEIVKQKSRRGVARERVRTIETKFRLVHLLSGCVLFSHNVKLPEWASGQQEVTCANGGSLPNSLWYVEYNEHPQLGEDAERVNYRKPGFLGKFWELQKVMWQTNAGLTDSHAWDSRPEAWPILRRGINFWGRNHTQIYLIGNPIIWWASSLAVLVWAVFKGVAILRWQRNCNDYSSTTFKRFDYEIGTFVFGWALHYFPFFLMQRQLFLHHYFPALYFAMVALCQLFDYLTARIPVGGIRETPYVNRVVTVCFLALSISAFVLYAPLAYGNSWTKSDCKRVQLFDTWDWDCNNFHDSYDAYSSPESLSGSSSPAATPTVDAKGNIGVAGEGGLPAQSPDGGDTPPKVDKVEYRDEKGNILDPEQVKALKGKVEFHTQYVTQSHVVDEHGNSVLAPPIGAGADANANAGQVPPHPEAEGINKETVQKEDEVSPQGAAVSRDGEMEAEQAKAKPAGEGKEATGRDEL